MARVEPSERHILQYSTSSGLHALNKCCTFYPIIRGTSNRCRRSEWRISRLFPENTAVWIIHSLSEVACCSHCDLWHAISVYSHCTYLLYQPVSSDMWNRLKISQDARRNAPHDSEGSMSDETSDRIDADCASVMSFNMHDFDQETANRFAKHASVRANHHHVAEIQHSNCCRRSFASSVAFIRAHWVAALMTSFIFLILSIGTVTLGAFQLDRTHAKVRDDALANARDITHYFSEQFEKAMLPLLTLEQLIHEIPVFAELTNQIGAPNEAGSLPYERLMFRNLTGSLCLNPDVTKRYDEAVQRILDTFSVLQHHLTKDHGHAHISNPFISISLAPRGVICLTHQIDPQLGRHIAKVVGRPVNTTDFMGFDIGA